MAPKMRSDEMPRVELRLGYDERARLDTVCNRLRVSKQHYCRRAVMAEVQADEARARERRAEKSKRRPEGSEPQGLLRRRAPEAPPPVPEAPARRPPALHRLFDLDLDLDLGDGD